MERKAVASRAREQTEKQAGAGGCFGNFARTVSIGVSNDFGSLSGYFAKTFLAIPDLRANLLRKTVRQDGVVAGVISEEHQRMTRELCKFRGREGPVQIADRKERRSAEA